jgi:hypothetical protein
VGYARDVTEVAEAFDGSGRYCVVGSGGGPGQVPPGIWTSRGGGHGPRAEVDNAVESRVVGAQLRLSRLTMLVRERDGTTGTARTRSLVRGNDRSGGAFGMRAGTV